MVWQCTPSSNIPHGVGADAAHVVGTLARLLHGAPMRAGKRP
ncbi:hypothetical protein AB0L44_19295 [Nonomuraea wenchangensis]